MPDFSHDATTVAARTDSSERAWRSLETFKPPRENARSASAAVAMITSVAIDKAKATSYLPGAVRTSSAMRARADGKSARQYLMGSETNSRRGTTRYVSSSSPAETRSIAIVRRQDDATAPADCMAQSVW